VEPSSTAPPQSAPLLRRRFDLQLLLALGVAVALWSYGIQRRSLWLDEFHSLQHDRQPDLVSFFESVRSDNHPPLSFLLQRGSIGIFGESELALRLPALLTGIGLLLLTWHVGRRLPDLASRRYALWIVTFSSFCFDVFTEARMYGLLCLCHYYFFHSLFLSAVVVGVLALRNVEVRRRLAGFVVPVALGVLGFLPWAVWGFREQLHHGLPPGGNYRGLNALAQSIGHLFYLNASAGGALLTYGVALPGTLAAAVFGALGLRRLWRATDQRLLLFVLLALGLGVPLWSHTVSVLYERASYG